MTEIFNNREFAIITWSLIIAFWFLSKKSFRMIVLTFLKNLTYLKIIIPIFLMFVYVGIAVDLLSKYKAWDISLLKDTLYWFIFVGVFSLLNITASINNKKDYFKKIILTNLKLVMLVEFVVNLYTFNYLVELILIPITTIVFLLNVFSETKKEYWQVKKISDCMLYFIGIFFIIFAFYKIVFNYETLITSHNLTSLALPAILSIVSIPYLFLFTLLIKYELILSSKITVFYYKFKEKLSIFFKMFKKIRSIIYIIPFALLISISQNISSRSQLEFTFSSMNGGVVVKDKIPYYQFRHSGLITNKSKEKNTITSINLLVWEDENQDKTLRDSFGPDQMFDNKSGEEIKLPLIIEGREAIDVDIYNKLSLVDSEDSNLLSARKPVSPGSLVTLPKYNYQLTFTDINDNEFDEQGKLINRDVVNMNWTLGNYCNETHYELWLCLRERIKILVSKFMFRIKTIFHWFGMESIGDLVYELCTKFEK